MNPPHLLGKQELCRLTKAACFNVYLRVDKFLYTLPALKPLMEIELSYTQITAITEKSYDAYHLQPGAINIAHKVAIEPFETAMKAEDKAEFDFGSFKVNRKLQQKKFTSWARVYSSLTEFLKIRADDSRAAELSDVKSFEGVGYCILIDTLVDFIIKQESRNTSSSEFAQLYWPVKKKEEEHPREIFLPDRDYSIITPETGKIVLVAKRFCSGLEKEVVEAFKGLNQEWFENETNCSKDNLPKKEESPLRRTRKLAKGKYIFVSLIREEEPKYREIIETLLAELSDLKNQVSLPGYRTKLDRTGAFVNIKSVLDRISLERLWKDGFVKVEGRYEIAP